MTDRPSDENMSMDEVALRAALNVLRDSVESKCMPSGWALEASSLNVHEKAITQLETMLRKVQRRTGGHGSGAAR